MQDGDLSGPVRSGTSVQAEECFTTLPDILESDPSTSASPKRLILLRNSQLYTETIAKCRKILGLFLVLGQFLNFCKLRFGFRLL